MRFKYYLRGAGIGVIVATLILSITFLFQDNISDEEVIRRAIKLGMVMEENTPGKLSDLQMPGGTSSVDLETGTDKENSTGVDVDNNASDGNSSKEADQTSKGASAIDNNNVSKDTDKKAKEEQEASQKTDSSKKEPVDEDGTSNNKNNDNSSSKQNENNTDEPAKTDPDKNVKSQEPADTQNTPEQSDEVEIVIQAGDVSRMVSAKVFEAGLVESADEFNSYLGAHGYDNMLQPGTYKITRGSSFRQIARILTTRQ